MIHTSFLVQFFLVAASW